jgi:hypothetical protein
VAGRLATRRWLETAGLERLAVSTALGLSLLAHLAFALGALGLLARGPLIGALAAVHLLGFPVWREAVQDLRARWGRKPILASLGVLAALAPLFVLALYPPTAFDETLYHLPYARAFARAGTLPFLPELRNPVFPQLDELLSTGMLLLAGDVSTHLVQLLATLVTAALLLAWGRSEFSPAAGWLAAATFLGNPIVVHLAGTGYVEPAQNLFAAGAVHALERWRRGRSEGKGWLALAAVFAASSAGTKYLGLFFVGAVLAGALPAALRERRTRDLILATLVCLAVLAPTYGRILADTGNPLFPFYPGLFGANPWTPGPAVHRPLSERVVDYLRFPSDVFLDRDEVGGQPPYSPVYLFALPLLALGFLRDPRVRRLLMISLAYSLLFFVLPPDSRYMTAFLPLVSLALAGTLASWRLRPGVLPALAVLLFLPGWAYGLYRLHREGPLPVTAGEREVYLTRKLPTYAALAHLNRLRGRSYTIYGLHTENMVYHAEGILLGDWSGPARYSRVVPVLGDPEALHRRLRELGAGYLLLPRERGIRLPRDPAWSRRFHRVYSDARADVYELAP